MDLRSLRINDESGLLSAGDADICIFAAGYEPRCTFVYERLLSGEKAAGLADRTLLLSFKTHREVPSRRAVDATFSKRDSRWHLEIATDDSRSLLEKVRSAARDVGPRCASILIDYSGMSRMLYLSLLELLKDGHKLRYAYSIGKYDGFETNYPISAVGAIKSVPGLEGVPLAERPKVYVFGLGFDAIGTRALVDRLEAGTLVTFWADPGASPGAAATAERLNDRVIARSHLSFCTDLRDVSGTVRLLDAIACETAPRAKLVLVPVGPKPHVIACGIVASQYQHVTLLAPHLQGGGVRDMLPMIDASGEVIVTTLEALKTNVA